MRKGTVLLFLIILPFYIMGRTNDDIDSLFKVLDRTIENSGVYENAKNEKIQRIKLGLEKNGLTLEKRYKINLQLYGEYEYYICDEAWKYIDANIEIAKKLHRDNWLNESLIKKAHILATSGLFAESIELLNTVDKSKLDDSNIVAYYRNYELTYLYHSEYAQGNVYSTKYLEKTKIYRDSAFMYGPNYWNSREVAEAQACITAGDLKTAEKVLSGYARQLDSTSRDYSVAVSTLAYVYELLGDVENRKKCLVLSAISDINCVIKENVSLRQLADILFKEGDIERANAYLKKSMVDAIKFNARLRGMQASLILPMIDSSYQYAQEAQKNQLLIYLTIIGLLSLFLIVAVLFIIRQMKKLAQANRKVKTANLELQKLNLELEERNENLADVNEQQQQENVTLSTSNSIKEESIGQLVSMCSTYISQLESYRNLLNKKANLGKMEDLFKTLKSKQIIDDTLEEFYKYFDSQFLGIFPHFVESVNRLFPAEEKILTKQPDRLNAELRIVALIRLGITDSGKIANFLRFSITTVYTYRSKMKNKSQYKEEFESRIMKIGTPEEQKL